ncbi:hypothetical protein KKA00_10775 [bacterium]|nr:hypothetical protein [bacterium]MBU1881605.1 hypothetical protein [bacterium]
MLSASLSQAQDDSLAVEAPPLSFKPALQSLVVPGWGQISQGEWPRGLVYFGGQAFLAADAFYYWEEQYGPQRDNPERDFYRNLSYGLAAWYGLGVAFNVLDVIYYQKPVIPGSATSAVFQSMVFPGWGQLANGQHWKAGAMFLLQTSLGYSMYYQHQNYVYYKSIEDDRAGFFKDQRNRLIWWSAFAMIFSATDAYVDAHLREWDVSDDLSLAPTFFDQYQTMGIRLTLSLP